MGLIAIWTIVSLNASDRIFNTGILSYLEQTGLPLVIFSLPLMLILISLYFVLKRKLPYSKKKRLIGNLPNWFIKMGNEIPFAIVLLSFVCFFYSMFFLQD